MSSHRMDRVSADMKRALSEIFRELKDPRISQLLSVVKLDVSNDLSYATVYVSAIEGFDRTVESVKGLKSAAGYIRKELSSRLKIRKTPELRFVADDSIEYGAQISRMIEDFDISDDQPED